MDSLRLLMFMSVILMASGDIEDDFRELYEVYSDNHLYLNEMTVIHDQLSVQSVGAEFNCPSSVSPEKPTSVHQLRPGDINVIATVGDSLSTAYAAGAPIFLPIMLNYWGVSASIGGDDNLKSIGTLPNILREYNPDIYGYATGTGVVFTNPKKKRLNHAVVGATADNLAKQVRKLIDDLHGDSNVDMENDWKFITLFIGGNDLCSGCTRDKSQPAVYLEYIEEAILILRAEVPRAMVNLVGVLNAYMLPDLEGGLKCNLVHRIVCKCLSKSGGKEEIYDRAKEYQRIVQEAIESGKFDDKDDFTVVYQPFFHDTHIPRKENGDPDASYFAPDCFHLSQKGQAAQAVANWNGLFEPVGAKRLEWVPGEKLECPSEEFPFIYTNVNSKTSMQAQGGPKYRPMGPDDYLFGAAAAGPSHTKGLSSHAVIIISVMAGTMVIIIVVGIMVTMKKKHQYSKISYQDL